MKLNPWARNWGIVLGDWRMLDYAETGMTCRAKRAIARTAAHVID